MDYYGNRAVGSIIYGRFNTKDSNGNPVAMTDSPAVRVYKDNGTTESSSGVTLTQAFDGRVGLHLVTVDTSADPTFYAAGHDFLIVITAGKAKSVNLAGSGIGYFQLENDYAASGIATLLARLTNTRAGYLDNLPNLDAAVSTRLASSGYTAPLSAAGTRSALGLASANLDTQIDALPTAAEAAAAVRVELATELARIDAAISSRLAGASYAAPLDAAGTRSAVGLSSANLDTQLAALAGYIDTEVAGILAVTAKLDTALELDTGAYRFTAAALAEAPSGGGGGGGATAADVADAVLDELVADHVGAGSLGAVVAGILAAVDTEIAAIKAKTDNLPSDPADASDIASAFSSVSSLLTTIAGYIDTEVAAIKAKTDNLPAAPAASSDVPSAATVAAAVRTELATELARVDVATSTRATPGDVPAAATVASAVRSELTTELGRLDAATSSRATTAAVAAAVTADHGAGSYIRNTEPLDAAGVRAAVGLGAANLDTQIADLPTAAEGSAAVRLELATELARVDAATSSRATPAQVNAEADAALADAGYTSTRAAKLDALPVRLRRNTAFPAFHFLLVSSADHLTGATGKTVTAERLLDDGTFEACANTPTEKAHGFYAIDLEAVDLDGAIVTFRFTAPGCDAREITAILQEAA